MATITNPNRNAWVQLYEARSVPSEPESALPGRPPGIVPRRKVGLTLSQGEITELEHWQERFSQAGCTARCPPVKRSAFSRASATSRFAHLEEAENAQAWLSWWKN